MSWTAQPQRFDLVHLVGETLALTVELVDADGVAVDLTGATGEAAVVAELGGGVVLEPVVTVTSAAGGQFTVTSTAAATAGLRPGTYRWGVRVTFGDGSVKTILEGELLARYSPVR
ncbi:MAG: hypothetical protein ABMA64_07065 [Myxococcota bacterium]